MADKGEAYRSPRSQAEINAGGDGPDAGETAVVIPLLLDKHRPARANISLDAGLLEQITRRRGRRA